MDTTDAEMPEERHKTEITVNIPTVESTGVLNKLEILKHLEQGDIVISPFNANNLGTNSYDITLGEYYWTTRVTTEIGLYEPPLQTDYVMYDLAASNVKISDPYDVTQMPKTWHIKKAISVRKYMCELRTHMSDASLEMHWQNNSRIIIVNPGDHILAHTAEYIGGNRNIFASLGSRSSTRRVGCEVCRDAGIGDIGYRSKWTLEISNSTDKPLLLVVGNRYGQMIFNKCVGALPPKIYGENDNNSKYQQTSDLELDKKVWTPYKMLPKKFLDIEFRNLFNLTCDQPIFHKFNPVLTFDNHITNMKSENEIFQQGWFFVIESMFLDACTEISHVYEKFIVHKDMVEFAFAFHNTCDDQLFKLFNYQMFSKSVFIPKLYMSYMIYVIICAHFLRPLSWLRDDKNLIVDVQTLEAKNKTLAQISDDKEMTETSKNDRFYELPEYLRTDEKYLVNVLLKLKDLIKKYVSTQKPFCVIQITSAVNHPVISLIYPNSNSKFGSHLSHFLNVLTNPTFF